MAKLAVSDIRAAQVTTAQAHESPSALPSAREAWAAITSEEHLLINRLLDPDFKPGRKMASLSRDLLRRYLAYMEAEGRSAYGIGYEDGRRGAERLFGP